MTQDFYYFTRDDDRLYLQSAPVLWSAFLHVGGRKVIQCLSSRFVKYIKQFY